jgi:hypothetical protein
VRLRGAVLEDQDNARRIDTRALDGIADLLTSMPQR